MNNRSKKAFSIRFTAILFLLVACLSSSARAAGIEELRKNFAHPPDDARIMMRWWWFGPAVTKSELERELRVMKAAGIGGVEVQPVYPLLPDDPQNGIKNLPYLSDEFLEMLRFASEKCNELGMRFDLTLGSGWSFGGAKTPISEAAGQLRVERMKFDGKTSDVRLPYMIPAEKLLAVFATQTNGSPETANEYRQLTALGDANVLIPADIQKGSEILFFISSKSGMQVKRPAVGAEGYVLNHLDKPSVEDYLKTTGDRLFSVFNRDTIPYSIFCDSLEVYNQDWTDDLLEEFQKRRGYDLKPFLPALVMDIGPKTTDIRYDWGRTLTELFNERFMIPLQAWSKENNTRFRIQGYGLPPAAISSNQWADIADGEGAQWTVVRAARWASSANHVYGRNITSSETWTWLHSPVFRATPLDMKAEADIHFLQGINQLIGHGFAYTPPEVEYPGWRFYAAGIYDEKNPWWIVMPDLTAYLQRMSWLIRQGTPQNDVALYLPNADAYAHFSAGKIHLIDAERELVGGKIMPAIFEAGYNLDFFDDEILRTTGRVEKNELLLGPGRHRIVILPGIERMPLESLKKLDDFVKAGGILVATRRLPAIVPGFKTSDTDKTEFTSIVRSLFSQSDRNAKFVESEEDLGAVLSTLTAPDAAFSRSAKDFGFVHRRTDDSDIYFVANTGNQKQNVEITFRSTSPGIEVWDGMNGAFAAAPVEKKTAVSTTLALDFEPYQSKVIVFSKKPSNPNSALPPLTLAATIDLARGWNISIGQNRPTSLTLPNSWTDERSTRYFSGVATYERSFDLPNKVSSTRSILDFGSGTALAVQPTRNGMQTWFDPPIREAALVYVNGKRAGSLWCPPYKIDIGPFLKPGRNDLKIEVGNTALNYMAGHRLPDYRLLTLRYGERFQAQDMDKIEALPSGILAAPILQLFK